TFRANPAFKTEDAITALGVGEALVSTLEGKGTPTVVQKLVIRPPASQIGPVDEAVRSALLAAGPFAGRYDLAIDRQSAYEVLATRTEAAAREEQALAAEKAGAKAEAQARPSARTTRTTRSRREPDGFAEAFAKSAMRSASRQLGTALARGLLGSLFKGR
ncbi:MAG TPA: helicase HerA-like domain-containing protein, partial [Rhodospirillales bacterium]|nr:helicase HerA-like domain-containing protein [Rhodospirillales bacterium]